MGLEGLSELGITWQIVLLSGLSLSIGWGIRGNFGHEYGAAIPGALAAVAIVLVVGRPDWWHRVHYFAMFGALGWSFGGSMSYMQVVGYTHSGHSPSVLYGFANVFALGFLWAAVGGAGVAIPAFLSSEQLALFFVPVVAVFVGWALQNVFVDLFFFMQPGQRHENPLYWYDTDWLATLIALLATLVVVAVRGGFDVATSLILYIAVGWYAAFLLLVNVLKLRMTPPRGDNWAGCVGLVIGILVFCWQYGLGGIALATLVTGILGGLAFSGGQMIKLLCIKTGVQTNWHSVMEQTQGFLFGVGLAVTFGLISKTAPLVANTPPMPQWMDGLAVMFVLVLLTYLNHRKATRTWLEQVSSLPERPFRLPVAGWFLRSKGWIGWFEIIYIVIGWAVVVLLAAHFREPLALIPTSWIGKGQLLYLIFLWWVVVFNFERALVGFSSHRLVTEGTITLNAVIATVLILVTPQMIPVQESILHATYAGWIQKAVITGVIALVLTTLIAWRLTHLLFGHQPAPGAGLNIRFGPNATATKAKPKSGEAHP